MLPSVAQRAIYDAKTEFESNVHGNIIQFAFFIRPDETEGQLHERIGKHLRQLIKRNKYITGLSFMRTFGSTDIKKC